jgi:biopolymer transport protein ExbD
MNFTKRNQGQQAGFQMAPMVDIMFLLLIFFMTAFIFAQWENKLGIQVPTADSGKRASRLPGEVIINLDKDGKIYINSIEMGAEKLQSLLSLAMDTSQQVPVIIRGDADVPFKEFVRVLDICRKADVVNVSIASLPPTAEGSAN